MTETHYGAKLWYRDGHTEVSWWWGQPSGFWSWFRSIDQGYHPNVMTKAAVIKGIETVVQDAEIIREG